MCCWKEEKRERDRKKESEPKTDEKRKNAAA